MNAPNPALTHLLFCLADDDLVLGHRNSEWTGLAPIIEEDIAFSSMAQDEIGHAQAYYTLLSDLGEGAPDRLAFLRGASEFRNARLMELPRGDWAFSVMRQFLADAAEGVRLAALSRSGYKPLVQLARKLAGEEKYHWMHGRSWVQHLGTATGESHARVQRALDELYPHALGMFEATAWDGEWAATGLAPRAGELLGEWHALIAPVLRSAGLIPPDASPVLGGRRGRHTPHLQALLDDMQLVFRSDPEAVW